MLIVSMYYARFTLCTATFLGDVYDAVTVWQWVTIKCFYLILLWKNNHIQLKKNCVKVAVGKHMGHIFFLFYIFKRWKKKTYKWKIELILNNMKYRSFFNRSMNKWIFQESHWNMLSYSHTINTVLHIHSISDMWIWSLSNSSSLHT